MSEKEEKKKRTPTNKKAMTKVIMEYMKVGTFGGQGRGVKSSSDAVRERKEDMDRLWSE